MRKYRINVEAKPIAMRKSARIPPVNHPFLLLLSFTGAGKFVGCGLSSMILTPDHYNIIIIICIHLKEFFMVLMKNIIVTVFSNPKLIINIFSICALSLVVVSIPAE
eukprot:UN10633